MFSFLGMSILNVKFSLGNIFGITNLRNNISISNIPQHHQLAIIDKPPKYNSKLPSAKNISSVGGGYENAFSIKNIPTKANIM